MAPNLATHDHHQLVLLNAAGLSKAAISQAIGCSEKTVSNTRVTMRNYGNPRAPRNKPGPPRCITPAVGEAILERLRVKPDLYRDEIVSYLEEVFETPFSVNQVSRFLKEVNWNRKVVSLFNIAAAATALPLP